MEIIGVIAEYSPFHNGHLYQLKTIKEKYPNSLIIIVLNGYFLQRGIPSIESKEEKTKLALKYGADLVVSLPFAFGSNSADFFAEGAIEILNHLKANKIVFGSESNNVELLKEIAVKQLDENFNELVKSELKKGNNYPTALSKSLGNIIDNPNDLLGISYIKSILKNKYDIEPITIKRTNDFHDTDSNDKIISATNIREKIKNKEEIKNYIPEGNIISINYSKLFELLKYKILTDNDLSKYLGVEEGLDKLLLKNIDKATTFEELIKLVKTKRYTYNRISRTLIHILLSFTKENKEALTNIEYIHILGFNSIGENYLKQINKNISINTSIDKNSKTYELEIRSAKIFELITDTEVINFEKANKPVIFK